MENLKNAIKKIKLDNIVVAVLTIVLGVLCIVLPQSSAQVLCYVLGSVLLVIGVTMLIKYFAFDCLLVGYSLITGISLIIAGILCFVNPALVQSILTVLFGVYIVIDSMIAISDSVTCARMGYKSFIIMFLLALATLVLGVFVIFGSFETIMLFAGISLLVEGTRNLICTLIFSKKVNKAKKDMQNLYNKTFVEPDDVEVK